MKFSRLTWFAYILHFTAYTYSLSSRMWTAVFVHPVDDTCFPNNSPITLAVSLPNSIFLEESCKDPTFKFFLNGNLYGEGFVQGNDLSEDGYSLMITLPQLVDGNYTADFQVYASRSENNSVFDLLATGSTRFEVDTIGKCESAQAALHMEEINHHDSDSLGRTIVLNVAKGGQARMSSTVCLRTTRFAKSFRLPRHPA